MKQKTKGGVILATIMMILVSFLMPVITININGMGDSVISVPGSNVVNAHHGTTPGSVPPSPFPTTPPADSQRYKNDPQADAHEEMDRTGECGLLAIFDPRKWIPCGVAAVQMVLLKMITAQVSAVSVALSASVHGALTLADTMPTNSSYNNGITELWKNMRDIALILLTVALLIIAFANILNINSQVYGLNRMLPKIALTIFLTIFSKAIAEFILAFSVSLNNTLMLMIGRDFLNNFTYWPPNPVAYVSPTSSLDIQFALLMAIIVVIIMLIATIALIVLLTVRMIMIFLLIGIAPLAFMLQLLPFTENYYKQWWKEYIKWVFMGPIIMVILHVGTLVVSVATPGSGFLSILMLGIAYILAATIPLKMGNAMTSFLGNQMKKIGNMAKGHAKSAFKDRWDSFRAPRRAAVKEKRAKQGASARKAVADLLPEDKRHLVTGGGRFERNAFRENFKDLSPEEASERLKDRVKKVGFRADDQETLALMDKVGESHMGDILDTKKDAFDTRNEGVRKAFAKAFNSDADIRATVLTNKDENATQKVFNSADAIDIELQIDGSGNVITPELRKIGAIKATGNTALTTSTDSIKVLEKLAETENRPDKKAEIQRQIDIVYEAADNPESYKRDPRNLSQIIVSEKTVMGHQSGGAITDEQAAKSMGREKLIKDIKSETGGAISDEQIRESIDRENNRNP